MELEKVVELKNKLEKEIKLFIVEKYAEFELATNLYPSNISIDMINVNEFGERPKNIITNINIIVEL